MQERYFLPHILKNIFESHFTAIFMSVFYFSKIERKESKPVQRSKHCKIPLFLFATVAAPRQALYFS